MNDSPKTYLHLSPRSSSASFSFSMSATRRAFEVSSPKRRCAGRRCKCCAGRPRSRQLRFGRCGWPSCFLCAGFLLPLWFVFLYYKGAKNCHQTLSKRCCYFFNRYFSFLQKVYKIKIEKYGKKMRSSTFEITSRDLVLSDVALLPLLTWALLIASLPSVDSGAFSVSPAELGGPPTRGSLDDGSYRSLRLFLTNGMHAFLSCTNPHLSCSNNIIRKCITSSLVPRPS